MTGTNHKLCRTGFQPRNTETPPRRMPPLYPRLGQSNPPMGQGGQRGVPGRTCTTDPALAGRGWSQHLGDAKATTPRRGNEHAFGCGRGAVASPCCPFSNHRPGRWDRCRHCGTGHQVGLSAGASSGSERCDITRHPDLPTARRNTGAARVDDARLDSWIRSRGRTFESCRAHGSTKPFSRARNAEKCTIRPSYSASVRTGEADEPCAEGAGGEGVLGLADRGAGGLGASEDRLLRDRRAPVAPAGPETRARRHRVRLSSGDTDRYAVLRLARPV